MNELDELLHRIWQECSSKAKGEEKAFLSLTCLTTQATIPVMAKKKNRAAQELGRLGGLKGGNARAKKLSPERRAEIARAAAAMRWAKKESAAV